MSQRRIPAVYMRGGTSRCLVFHDKDLPPAGAERDRILLAALGSPDPYGRQLNGLGGGISSLSKACIIGPPSHPDADVDYTFAQVEVSRPVVDYTGNCGNCSSSVGPFAIDEGLVSAGADGVAGRGARIALDFVDPGGAGTGKLLPTGRPIDTVDGLSASLVDATNAMVFVRAKDIGLTGTESPQAMDGDRALMERLERIRVAAALMMGIPGSAATPKVAVVAPPASFTGLDGNAYTGDQMDLVARVISMGNCHRAFALTAAMCLAVAARLPGTVVRECSTAADDADVRLAHPSGILPLDARVVSQVGQPHADRVTVYRTARRLMEGFVRVP